MEKEIAQGHDKVSNDGSCGKNVDFNTSSRGKNKKERAKEIKEEAGL